MHRSACRRIWSGVRGISISLKSYTRSSIARCPGSSRLYLKKPFSAIENLFGSWGRLCISSFGCAYSFKRFAIIYRHNFHKFADHIRPSPKYPLGLPAACPLKMFFNKFFEDSAVFILPDTFQIDHIKVAQRVKKLHFVEYISNSAAHPCCEIASGFTKYNHSTARHILTPVVAYPLYDSRSTA